MEEVRTLRSHLRTGKTEWRVARRARILLDIAEGKYPCQIAEVVGCDTRTVSRVRERFRERGLEAIYDAPRSGRPPEISPPRQGSNR
jgi:transposase